MTRSRPLGTVFDDKLEWTANVDLLCKRANQRLFFLRKLRQFRVNQKLLRLLYQAVVQSTLLFNLVCFYGNLKKADADRLRRVISVAAKILREEVRSSNDIFEEMCARKCQRLLGDSDHPLHAAFAACVPNRQSTSRLLSVRTRTNRFRNSFVPTAIRLHNASLGQPR